MRLAYLTLTDFRNFASLQTGFPPGPTIVVGANARGKTSLLEAVYYLVGASSPTPLTTASSSPRSQNAYRSRGRRT